MSGGYGPRELVTDPLKFGLDTTTVSNELGSCVARHPGERRSTRATVFLHGAAGSWTTWTPILLLAAENGIDLGDTVLLDLPGWGNAVMTDHRSGRALEAISSLVEKVTGTLGYTEWDLVGHSLGGFVALHLAATRPERVLSVRMVSGTTFSVIESIAHPFRRFSELPGFTMLWRVMQFLSALGPVGTAMVRGMGRVGLLRPVTFPLFRHWRRVPKSQGVALAHELRPRAFTAAARATIGYDAVAIWSGIRCPVFATRGDRDIFVRADDLERLRAILPNAVLTAIADCGHFGNVERPLEVLTGLGYRA